MPITPQQTQSGVPRNIFAFGGQNLKIPQRLPLSDNFVRVSVIKKAPKNPIESQPRIPEPEEIKNKEVQSSSDGEIMNIELSDVSPEKDLDIKEEEDVRPVVLQHFLFEFSSIQDENDQLIMNYIHKKFRNKSVNNNIKMEYTDEQRDRSDHVVRTGSSEGLDLNDISDEDFDMTYIEQVNTFIDLCK